MDKIYKIMLMSCLSMALLACGNEGPGDINKVSLNVKGANSVNNAPGADGKDGTDGHDGAAGKDGADGKNGRDAKEAQAIHFAENTPEYAFVGDRVTRAVVGGLGSGAISYSSDNPAIARVDANTGVVDVLAPGSTLIWAHKSADTKYSAANDFYSLSVAPGSVSFTAMTGSRNAQLAFPAEAHGLGLVLYHSTNPKCNPDAISICQNAAQYALQGSEIFDPNARYQRTSTYWLKHGDRQSRGVTISSKRFSSRFVHEAVTFNDGSGDKLWLIGGDDNELKNDVWSSSDGINWVQKTAQAAFSARKNHQIVTFNDGSGDKLWLIGGFDGAYKNDVWSSSDGIHWQQQTANAAFSARKGHQVATFNDGSGDKLWLIGGDDGIFKNDIWAPRSNAATKTNDVWSSSDGVNWVQQMAGAAFSAREDHQVIVFDNGSGEKLWLIGGDNGTKTNDVWSSSDGIHWQQQTAGAAFSARKGHQVVAFDSGSENKLWLIGGDDNELKNDVWSSSDGIHWQQQTAGTAFSARKNHRVVVFNNGSGSKFWLLGGNEGMKTDDVWSSSDGINWQQQTAKAEFSARRLHQVVSFNNGSGEKLWLIGGDNGTKNNDIWSSSDGVHWQQQTASAAFSARKGHQVIAFNDGSGNKLWLIGGDDGTKTNDVWSSSDGINWQQQTASAAFSAREGHQVIAFDNGSGEKLWLIGGDDNELKNDVWSSSDGVHWQQQTAGAAFSARQDHQVVAFNNGSGNKLWLIGGDNNAFKNDIWSSSDGINWVEQTDEAAFSARRLHQVVSFNAGNGDRLWLIGGDDGMYKNDIWSSSDGISWTARAAGSAFSGRFSHQVVSFNNGGGEKLWLIGGDDIQPKNDVWSTSDGIDWRYSTHSVIQFD